MVRSTIAKFECVNATMGYGRQEVLRKVSFSLEPGAITCLLGSNGVGKTTLFKSILGFLPLLKGEIRLNGRNINQFTIKEFAKHVAYVPQIHQYTFPYKTRDVILFGRTAYLGMFNSPGKHDRKIADHYMDLLDIRHLADKPFTELSGGEKQMVIVARALTQEASFIILDEPTSNLDYGNQLRIIQKIKSLGEQAIGVLMATHMPDHAFMLGSKALVLDKGLLFRFGSPESTVTVDTLKQIYGVEVQILDTPANGIPSRKICAPVIH